MSSHAYADTTVPVVDQQQVGMNTTVGGTSIGGYYQQQVAQTFTAGLSGALVEVRFAIGCTDADLSIEIQGASAAGPNGAVLGSQTIPRSSLAGFPATLRSFPLTTPIAVTAGAQYAIVLRGVNAVPPYGGCATYS